MEECKAADYANILYIRMLWKDLEPEEGKYAWIYNEQYKWYIQKAKDKGLKLAFRVFFHGVDGVPSYVYEAGATESPIDDEGKTQPYYDNPVFLEKLDKFVEAFAKEYDNPDEVDYIDAYGLGRWGEGHGLALDQYDYTGIQFYICQSGTHLGICYHCLILQRESNMDETSWYRFGIGRSYSLYCYTAR